MMYMCRYIYRHVHTCVHTHMHTRVHTHEGWNKLRFFRGRFSHSEADFVFVGLKLFFFLYWIRQNLGDEKNWKNQEVKLYNLHRKRSTFRRKWYERWQEEQRKDRWNFEGRRGGVGPAIKKPFRKLTKSCVMSFHVLCCPLKRLQQKWTYFSRPFDLFYISLDEI